MIVHAVIPCLRLRDGTEVKYRCTKCSETETEIFNPYLRRARQTDRACDAD